MTPIEVPIWLAPALCLFAGLLCLWNAFTIKGAYSFWYFRITTGIVSLPYIFYGLLSLLLINEEPEIRQMWVRPAQAFAFFVFLLSQLAVLMHNLWVNWKVKNG